MIDNNNCWLRVRVEGAAHKLEGFGSGLLHHSKYDKMSKLGLCSRQRFPDQERDWPRKERLKLGSSLFSQRLKKHIATSRG